MLLLILLFFLTGFSTPRSDFSGGSTYNALLVLHGTDYRILPAIAFVCNILVVAGGVAVPRSGNIKFGRIAPWIVTSIPFAWLAVASLSPKPSSSASSVSHSPPPA